jgi:hypothetical protein
VKKCELPVRVGRNQGVARADEGVGATAEERYRRTITSRKWSRVKKNFTD